MNSEFKLHDMDMREPLFEFLEENWQEVLPEDRPEGDACAVQGKMTSADRQHPCRTRIFEELPIGDSRADAVLVTESELCGIEIKSDADSYTRLKTQIPDYSRYFDRNLLVVGSTHAMHAAGHIPDWWGILSVELEQDGRWDFYIVRRPLLNPAAQDQVGAAQELLQHKLSLLWRAELSHIQQQLDMPKYTGKSRTFVSAKIAQSCQIINHGDGSSGLLSDNSNDENRSAGSLQEINRWISEELLQRDYTKAHESAEKGSGRRESSGKKAKSPTAGLSALRRRRSPVRRARQARRK